MKQQGTWLVYCLSFVYEAVFKFNYYSKLNSNWHQETSPYMTKEKKKPWKFQLQVFQISCYMHEEIIQNYQQLQKAFKNLWATVNKYF